MSHTRYVAIAALGLVLVGAYLRLIGVASMSLWLDEAVIANVVSGSSLAAYMRYPASNRPIGYLIVSGWLASWHNSELVLRLPSLIASLLSVALIVPLSNRLFVSRTFFLLSIFSLTASAWLVSFAKEFKPYAIEHALIVLWLLLLVSFRRSGRIAVLAPLAASLALAPLFTHAPLFAVPFFAIALIEACWRRGATRAASGVVACAIIAVVIAALQFWWIGSATTTAMFPGWEVNYFDPARDGSFVSWWSARLVAILTSFVPIDPWLEPTLLSRAFLGLCVVGWLAGVLRFVVRRELWLLCVLVGPLLPPTLLAVLARWPLGPERVNLFLVTLLTSTVLLGWEFVLRRSATACVAFAVLFVGLQLPVDLATYAHKDSRFGLAEEDLEPALQILAAREQERMARGEDPAAVVFNQMSSHAMRYYTRFNRAYAARNADFLHGHPVLMLKTREPAEVRDALREHLVRFGSIWIVLAHTGTEEVGAVKEALDDGAFETLSSDDLPGALLVGARVRPPHDGSPHR